MSLGLARRKELQKRRSQRVWGLFKVILVLSILIGSSYWFFDMGQEIAQRNMVYGTEKFDQLSAEMAEMRINLGNTEAELNKMQKLLPNQEMQDLLVVINEKAASGISPARMATMISGMSKDATCSDETLSKRFIIATPVSQQTDGSVR